LLDPVVYQPDAGGSQRRLGIVRDQHALGRNSQCSLYGPFASIAGRFGAVAIRADARIGRLPVRMVPTQNQSVHRPVGSFAGQPAARADRLAMAGGPPSVALGRSPPFST